METKVSQIANKMIADLAMQIKKSHPLFDRAQKGEITPRQIGFYLHNLFVILSKTESHLNLAKRSAEKKGLQALARHFSERVALEKGNQEWVKEDFHAFEFSKEEMDEFYISPAMHKLISYVESLAINQPESFLAYEFFTGSLIVLIGPELMELFQVHCQISLLQLQIVEKYLRLDNEYNLLRSEILDELIRPESLSEVDKAIRTSNKIFQDFLTEITVAYLPRLEKDQ